jgi:hypothetical protein
MQVRRRAAAGKARAFERRAKARQPAGDEGAEEGARLGLEPLGLRVIAHLMGRGRAGEQARDEFELQCHMVRQVVERLGAFQPVAPIPSLDGLHAAAHHGAVQIPAGIEMRRNRRRQKEPAVQLQQRQRIGDFPERGAKRIEMERDWVTQKRADLLQIIREVFPKAAVKLLLHRREKGAHEAEIELGARRGAGVAGVHRGRARAVNPYRPARRRG